MLESALWLIELDNEREGRSNGFLGYIKRKLYLLLSPLPLPSLSPTQSQALKNTVTPAHVISGGWWMTALKSVPLWL